MKVTHKKIIALLIITLMVPLGVAYYLDTRKSQELQVPDTREGYVIKNGTVYFRTIMQVGENSSDQIYDYEMKDADAQTFTELKNYWAKDKDSIFYMGQTLQAKAGTPSLDMESFTFSDDYSTGKDNKAVYYFTPINDKWFYVAIEGADPATFKVLEQDQYATDRAHAYYLDLPFDVKRIEGVDGSTFAVLGECAAVEVSRSYYAWDAKSVVAGDKILEGADRDTFKIVAGFNSGPDGMYMAGTYSVDKNHVYKNCGEMVPSGNPATCSAGDLKACE